MIRRRAVLSFNESGPDYLCFTSTGSSTIGITSTLATFPN